VDNKSKIFSRELPPLANPVEWEELRWHEIDAFRRLNCVHDPECVHYAASRAWRGFTCIYCPLEKEAALREAPIPLQRERFTQAIQEFKTAFQKKKGGQE
jgi:hypothetical protein